MTKRMVLLAVLLAGAAAAEKVNVPLSDPSRPALVKASTVNGSITVQTHNGREVIVEMDDDGQPRAQAASNGMRQIMTGSRGLSIEEESNVVRVSGGPGGKNANIVIYVPVKTSLNLRAVNGRGITVDGVDGDLDVDAVNGGINLTNVSGAAVAHSVNGKVIVQLRRVTPDKPMSFSTVNGTVDVTLPASIKADLKIRNDMGKVFTDFEMEMRSTTDVKRESEGGSRPKFQIRIDKTMIGKVNGGGAEIAFRSMNGTIYIRKGN